MKWCAWLLGLLLAAGSAQAQERSRVRRGNVDGIELAIDGGLVAPRGGEIRWLVTAYEVVGLSELRVASGVEVFVSTSLGAQEDAANATTDAMGRATVSISVPDDAPQSFTAVIRAVHENGLQRRFELPVRVMVGARIELHVARARVQPDGPLRAFGRLLDARTGRPIADATLRLTLRDGAERPLAAMRPVRTDSAGAFATTFEVPEDASGQVVVEARTDDDEHPTVARANAAVEEPEFPALLVAVAPGQRIVGPNAIVPVEVAVRSPEGRPIEDAVVTLDGARREDDGRRSRTDARGRARLMWRAPQIRTGIRDAAINVSAAREGWGDARGSAQVRIAAARHAASYAVEGGALAPAIGGRVWVRVVNVDGRAAGSGIDVSASGPRIGANVRASTDDDGIATLDLSLANAVATRPDRCGGQTATAMDIVVGSGSNAPRLTACPAPRPRRGRPRARRSPDRSRRPSARGHGRARPERGAPPRRDHDRRHAQRRAGRRRANGDGRGDADRERRSSGRRLRALARPRTPARGERARGRAWRFDRGVGHERGAERGERVGRARWRDDAPVSRRRRRAQLGGDRGADRSRATDRGRDPQRGDGTSRRPPPRSQRRR